MRVSVDLKLLSLLACVSYGASCNSLLCYYHKSY